MSTSANPIATGWLNENSLREYPFHEGCGLRPNDSAGIMVERGWSLPNCLVVDMSVSVVGSDFDPFLYLGRMSVVGGGVSLSFCDRAGEIVMSLYVDSASHEKNSSYQVAGTGSFSGSRGVICIGDIESFLEQTPEGAYSFSAEEARIEPTCIRPSNTGVRSLVAVDASGFMATRLYGDVNLVAGRNIRFDYSPSDNALVVSADPNAGYAEECECSGSGDWQFVRSINGVAVEKVTIVGDDCINVSTDSGIIRMTDECSRPCCGCAETIFINQTINDLQTSVGTLSGNVASLGDRLTSFVTSYLLSRKTLK